LDGLTPTHPSASVTDTRKAKLGGDQGQLYLAFLRTNEKVTISEDILVPVDGYAGAGARFLEKETMSQLQQAQRREHAGANADVEHARLPLLSGLKLLNASFDGLTVLHVAILIVEHAQEVFGEPVLGRAVRSAALRGAHDALAGSRSMGNSTPLKPTAKKARGGRDAIITLAMSVVTNFLFLFFPDTLTGNDNDTHNQNHKIIKRERRNRFVARAL
jgi:hypothetical protein